MDRVKHLKFKPFDNHFENLKYLKIMHTFEKPFKNNCEYYLLFQLKLLDVTLNH